MSPVPWSIKNKASGKKSLQRGGAGVGDWALFFRGGGEVR